MLMLRIIQVSELRQIIGSPLEAISQATLSPAASTTAYFSSQGITDAFPYLPCFFLPQLTVMREYSKQKNQWQRYAQHIK